MRLLTIVIAMSCLATDAPAADVAAGDWASVSAQAEYSENAKAPVVYSPDVSIAEFNKQLSSRDSSQYLLVKVSLSSDDVSPHHLVDRPVQFTWNQQAFPGRVAAAFITRHEGGPSTIQILAHIKNRQQGGEWILPNHAQGTLSVIR